MTKVTGVTTSPQLIASTTKKQKQKQTNTQKTTLIQCVPFPISLFYSVAVPRCLHEEFVSLCLQTEILGIENPKLTLLQDEEHLST